MKLVKELHYRLIENRLEGFFSNVMVILYALNSIKSEGLSIKNISVLWHNSLYQDNEENLYDKYLFANNNLGNNFIDINAIDLYPFPGPFLNLEIRNQLNTILHENYYTNNPYYKKNFLENIVKNTFVLGVQIRRTDHFLHGNFINLSCIIQLIQKELLNFEYEHIFIATDDVRCLTELLLIFKDKIIFNQGIARSTSDVPIHRANFVDKDKLANDVLKDAISLSKCTKILITSSNISSFALCLNKELKYEYMDRHIEYR